MTREVQLITPNRAGRSYVVVSGGGAVVATILDLLGFFNSFPFLLVGGSIIALAFVGFFAATSLNRGLVVGFAIIWALVLPHMRWNLVKAFYLDCGALSAGNLVDEARAKMSNYHLQNESAKSIERAEGLDRAHITFHPSVDRSADWCVVYFDGDRVVSVEEMRD